MRSGMGALHLSPQVLDGAKLKLLHRALAALELLGYLADALLLHKSHVNHTKLRLREPLQQLKQHGAAFDFVRGRRLRRCRKIPRLPARALKVIRNDSRSNSEQPRCEGYSAPLKLPNAGQRLPENVCRQVFGLMTIADAPRDIHVHTVEIFFVQVAKPRRVALRGFNPQPVVGALRHRPPWTALVKIIRAAGRKVTLSR